MTFPLARVDHLVLDTRDEMDEAVRVYRALGFQLTERSRHTLGSMNHLAVLEPAYLELLGYDPAAGPVRADIAQFPAGLNGLVFATESATDLYRELKDRGVPVEDPLDFSRMVNLPEGRFEARFRVVRFEKGAFPFGRVYFCQHFTPELIWRPEWCRHPNGATGIESVSIALRDPEGAAGLFTKMFGPDRVREIPGAGWRLEAGSIGIELLPMETVQRQLGSAMPEALGRSDFIAKVTIRTAALGAAGRRLVPAGSARNVALEFVEGVA
jgi:catechol 2,3-dioxygenase-like lactoylglutathione lyase family enzyme